jgi:murein DD-endopeptidase MepM/ murein hydrolase activator NlpD
MHSSPCLVLVIALCAAPFAPEAQTLVPPGTVRRGEPAFAIFAPAAGDAAAADHVLTIRYADGATSPGYRGFRLPAEAVAGGIDIVGTEIPANIRRGPVVLFLLSAPVDAALGEATMSVFGPDGQTLAGARFAIVDRTFVKEDLRLDAALTALRVDSDPVKAEQAVRYQAILATVNPEAGYLVGGFVRPVASQRQTSMFGMRRRYLYSDGSVDVTMHNGIDYGCPTGTPVVAAAAGRVVLAEDRIVTGKTIVIEHLPGTYTIYMHMSSLAVSAGALVGRGDLIGAVGMTGLATGPHLHWEFRVMGVACDPEALIGLDKMPSIRTILPAIEGR